MQTRNFRWVLATQSLATSRSVFIAIFIAIFIVLVAAATAACSQADNPYAKIADPPLVQARLHTMTVLATADNLAGQLATRGYTSTVFPSNYPASVRVEAQLWSVPEEVAGTPQHFIASSGPSIRLLIGLLPPDAPAADGSVERAFYRNVLGTDVPHWPANVPRPDNVHIQAWTFFVPSVVEASRKFRVHGIAVDFPPVALTTAYLGDHRTMGIRAPDGTVIELVESAVL